MRQPVPFGKYLLLDRISVGGMAEVFKAKSYGVEGFEKIIAIKRILPTMGEDRDFIKMFIDEAKIAGQLAHANICQIFELGRIDGSHFIAMEYIWGKDLLQIQNRLRKIKQAMPVQMACFTIAKVLEGLDYAHRKRDPLGRPLEIVHRDCSPQNVLVSYEGEVKVIDFGIAKATSRNSRTMAGVLKGKFGYMSPEQVRGLPLDRRSDIFALGTMLYECLTSDRLFQGETDFSTLEKVRNVDIQPPRSLNPAIPEVVENVIMKALAKDVDDRYQWCSEMLADLQQYLMAQEVVFTAKTLSSWLKEVFLAEIERERQLLEQYKRVGRDGLIGGVPSVQASRDVNEHLGEAAPVEGDPTTLGGPSFEDMEDLAAAAEMGPASGSPATQTPDEDHTNDFGEEAPTEIFGEIDEKPMPAAAQPSGRPSTSQPVSRPPKPPPGRPSREQPIAIAAQMSATNGAPRLSNNMPAMPPQDPYGYQPPQASPSEGFVAQSYAQQPYPSPYPGYGTPNQPQHAMNSQQMTGLAPPNQPQSRTLLGAAAPVGYGNYDPRSGSGSNPPPYGQPMQGYPSQPQMLGYPAPHPSQPYMQQPQGYPHPSYPSAGQLPGYMPPSGAFPAVPAMQEQALPVEGTRRKSTLLRDVLIGVAIAALVLVGFLAVKFFILDKDGSDTVAESSLGNVLIKLPKGVTAELFVDGKHNSTVDDAMKPPVSAGLHKLKLVATKGEGSCESDVKVLGGKDPTPFDCKLVADATKPSSDDAKPAVDTKTDSDAKPDTKTDAKADTKTDAKTTTATLDPKTDKTVAKTDPAHPTTTKTTAPDTKVKTPDPHAKDKLPPEDKAPTSPADPGPKGFLQVYSKPTAKILIDGVDTGMSTPISGKSLQLTPGKHKITFVIGDDRFTYSQTIKSGVTDTMSKDLQ